MPCSEDDACENPIENGKCTNPMQEVNKLHSQNIHGIHDTHQWIGFEYLAVLRLLTQIIAFHVSCCALQNENAQ